MEKENSIPRDYLEKGGLTHIHTEVSKDGFFSVEELGEYVDTYLKSEYLVINDHLTDVNLREDVDTTILMQKIIGQSDIVGNYNETHNGPVVILGVEANITDRGIDIPEELISEFDFVVASKHAPYGKESPEDWEKSIILAMNNPSVDAIGHINRLAPSGVNWARIFEVAQETRTIIEINTDSFPNEDLIKTMSEYNLLYSIGLDFHSFHGVKYRAPIESSVSTDLSEVRRIMASEGTDRDKLVEEYLNEDSTINPLRDIIRMVRILIKNNITPESVVNTKNYKEFIDFLSREKSQR